MAGGSLQSLVHSSDSGLLARENSIANFAAKAIDRKEREGHAKDAKEGVFE
jgi:hypothetical protein